MDIRKQNIIKISDEILSELLKFKENNLEFTFPLRERDSTRSKEIRLNEGCWFLGSDYIQIGLFNKGDKARACYTIGFVIHFKKDGTIKDNCINISFKSGITNLNEINFHNEIAKKLGIILDQNNVGEYIYSDNDYLKNLHDYLTRVRDLCLSELKKNNLEQEYIITSDDFNKQLKITNIIRENLKEDENLDTNSNQLSKDELIIILKSLGSFESIEFFNVIDNIVDELKLKQNDIRLSFNTARKKRLNLTIGQRMCLSIKPSKTEPYFFISDIDSPKLNGCQVTPFKGPTEAYECYSTDITDYEKFLSNIIEASKKELERSNKSSQRENYNQLIFEKAVFDKEFRNDIFESVFKENNYWALHCNPNFWDVISELKEYNDGTWKVNIGHKDLIKQGDKFLLWMSGEKAGIYAFGTVLYEPKEIEDNLERIDKFAKDKTQFSGKKLRIEISYDTKLLENPLGREKVLNSGIFEAGSIGYNFFYSPQGVNSRELSKDEYFKLKKMNMEFDQENIIKKFKEYLDKIFTGKSTSNSYISFMPKIQDWFIKNNVCNEGFNIWKDIELIPQIENSLSLEKKNLWKELNTKDNENGFYNAPWRKWIEFNNQINSNTINQIDNSSTITKYPKNIILFGPPGTGKTYHSIDKAIEIADFFNYKEDHKSNKKQFDKLKKEGQIEFVTFHQNYSYEDFMIGIRPDLTGQSSSLLFKPHHGIFYKIVKRALLNYNSSKLKQGKLIDAQELINNFLDFLQNGKIELKTLAGTPFSLEYISEDTIQLVFKNGSKGNTLSVQTLLEICEEKRIFTTSLKSYYYPLKEYILKDRIALDVNKEELKKFVIVIDEINRANISKVFGELITLLEDDKRIGEDEELLITLPNGEEFGIPPNLYVIGTMNTADKSIALIDIALRRRFEFIGKYPEYEENISKGYDKNSVELLKELNNAIYYERNSADYLIGQAYFMKNQPIEDTIRNKVIPLLMEYFSNKTEIVVRIFDKTKKYKVSYSSTDFKWIVESK